MIYYTIVIFLYVNRCVFKMFNNFKESQKLIFLHDLDHELFILFWQKCVFFFILTYEFIYYNYCKYIFCSF